MFIQFIDKRVKTMKNDFNAKMDTREALREIIKSELNAYSSPINLELVTNYNTLVTECNKMMDVWQGLENISLTAQFLLNSNKPENQEGE